MRTCTGSTLVQTFIQSGDEERGPVYAPQKMDVTWEFFGYGSN